MKPIMSRVVMSFMIYLICAAVVVNCDEKNINKLLNNQVIVSRQIMCVLEKSPCDQLGRQLKGNIFYIKKNPVMIFFYILIFVCICYFK